MAIRPTAFDLATAQKIARHVRDFDLIAQRRPRRQYFYGGGGGGTATGYAVIRSTGDGDEFTLQGQILVPVDLELGTWDVVGDVITMYTWCSIPSRYYQPFVWGGGTTMRAGNILPTIKEGGKIIVHQHIKVALLGSPIVNPPTNCQLVAG